MLLWTKLMNATEPRFETRHIDAQRRTYSTILHRHRPRRACRKPEWHQRSLSSFPMRACRLTPVRMKSIRSTSGYVTSGLSLVARALEDAGLFGVRIISQKHRSPSSSSSRLAGRPFIAQEPVLRNARRTSRKLCASLLASCSVPDARLFVC